MSKINAKKLAEAITLIIEAVGGGAASESEDAGGEEEAPKKGRGRPAGSTNKAKAETKPAAKGKTKAKDEDEEEEEDDGLGDDDGDDDDLGLGGDDEEVTQEDVVNAFKALKASKGIDKCREVLAKLDESNVLNIPPKKYAEALKEINRAASKK